MLTWDEIQSNAVAFSKKWQAAKSEEAEAQGFLIDFIHYVWSTEVADRIDPMFSKKLDY